MVFRNMGFLMIIVGLIMIVLGALFFLSGDHFSWLGNLPGDIRIERDNFTLYFPLTTMIIISILLNIIVRIFLYFFR
ncbi:DUF2905 domain-containing protein [Halanaerobium sp. Z-7514]|uniref:DUF2905 domain-containing protein n=1 Tax=Halanaerobium polyolivorans TaxID=2886943 RepID=A0AAW4X1N1_9FIRM|nr:DUF2905 domain-containing protein [Halanaerobium polyolivorans]MCC3145693.1 DUF2905 domain-containing protein [Halanaerobium polyolivorans]RQD78925.1 MAG: DUF2905 domain-containing protein [Halanaerobium sp. MSAO_Bac5]